MQLSPVFLTCAAALNAILFSASVFAQSSDQISVNDLKEQWGQVILCQRIYTLPTVKPRLYDFDTEQCKLAESFVLNIVSRYPEQQQSELKNMAERHAGALTFNTREPYHSVPACREFCAELATLQKKNKPE